MRPAVIFDLDQTLVGTRHIAHLRKPGKWNLAYEEIKTLKCLDDITNLIGKLNQHDVDIIIITTSPSTYCTKIIQHFGWKIKGKICYHDVSNIKPDPESFSKALKDFQLDPAKTISAGDHAKDIIASSCAGIPSVACVWDSDDATSLLASEPSYVAKDPVRLCEIILNFHQIPAGDSSKS